MAETTAAIRTTLSRTIRRRLMAVWLDGDGALLTPIQFPAVPGLVADVTGALVPRAPSGLPWLKLDLRWVESSEFTISQPALNKNVGIIQLAIFVPAGLGTAMIETLVGQARTVFNKFYGEGGLICKASSPGPDLKAGAWMASTVVTEFYCHEQTA
ncbi:MAG: hypothetical protein ABI977_22060 [Acidobacteriota bacterium]